MPSSTDIAIMRMVTDITVAHLETTKVETVLLPQLVSDLYRSFKAMEGQSSLQQSAPARAVVSAVAQGQGQPASPRRQQAEPAEVEASGGANPEPQELRLPNPPSEDATDEGQLPEIVSYRQPQTDQVPAVPIDQSVQWDHIVCLEDGKHLQMLKRYLRTRYQMSMEQYRAKWGLPPDYPATAPGYSAHKSEMAKRMGLGKSPKASRRRRAGE